MAKKMDGKLLSNQVHEIRFMARKLRVPQSVIRDAHLKIGRSRREVACYVIGYRAGLAVGEVTL